LQKQLQFMDATFLKNEATFNLYTYSHYNSLESIDSLFPILDEFDVETSFYTLGDVKKQEMGYQ
jgi:hypothetical protein